jgi:hypothetical protein
MNKKYDHIKAKKDAIKDIKESEKQIYVNTFPTLKKLPKEEKINIDTTKL